MYTVTREFYNVAEVNIAEFDDDHIAAYLNANGWVCKRAPDHAHAWMDEPNHEIIIPANVADDIRHFMSCHRRQDAVYEALKCIGDQIGRQMV
jgi:hypothetical protein